MLENNRAKYIQELEEQQERLKLLREGIINMTAHATKLTSKAYAELSKQEDSIKACGKATKNGVHYHSRVSMEGTTKIAQLNEDIYKLGAVLEHLENLKEQEEGSSDPSP